MLRCPDDHLAACVSEPRFMAEIQAEIVPLLADVARRAVGVSLREGGSTISLLQRMSAILVE